MSNFIVCVYATKDTPYVQVAESTILPSMKVIDGLRYSYSVVPNLGSWNKNTAYKATFALEMLAKYPTSNIVLLDADCQVLKYPDLFDNIPEQFNIAAHILDWATWYNRPGETTKELLTGTLFLKNTFKTKYLVQQWINGCNNSKDWEQRVLARVLIENKESVYNLPIGYTWINTMPFGEQPYVKCNDVVIRHLQASRDLKRMIK